MRIHVHKYKLSHNDSRHNFYTCCLAFINLLIERWGEFTIPASDATAKYVRRIMQALISDIERVMYKESEHCDKANFSLSRVALHD